MSSCKTIGIVAVSSAGAALCYNTICAEAAALLGPHDHPPIVMHSHPLAEYVRLIDANRWRDAAELLLSSADVLVRAGAQILICPDNTLHQSLDLVRDELPARLGVPWLHIADEVAALAAARGFRRLGILGTRHLMEGPVYRDTLAARGIASEIPSHQNRDRINAIIFDELVYGRIVDTSRRAMRGGIDELAALGCDAVVLGCTEIPLLVGATDSTLPVIDSTRTLARAALREAILRDVIRPVQKPSAT